MQALTKAGLIKLLLIIIIVSLSHSCKKAPVEKPGFSFAFLTDIHVQPETRATEGFKAAITEVNKLKPEFVITGGSLWMPWPRLRAGQIPCMISILKLPADLRCRSTTLWEIMRYLDTMNKAE